MTKKKIKVSIHEIIKLSNYANPNFGSFASFLKGLADSDGFIEVDSHNESVDQPTTPEKKCDDCGHDCGKCTSCKILCKHSCHQGESKKKEDHSEKYLEDCFSCARRHYKDYPDAYKVGLYPEGESRPISYEEGMPVVNKAGLVESKKSERNDVY